MQSVNKINWNAGTSFAMMTTDKSVQMTKCYGPWDGIGILSVIQIGLSSDFRFKFLSRDVHITDSKNKIPRKCSHFIFINGQRVYFIGVIWIDDNNFTFALPIGNLGAQGCFILLPLQNPTSFFGVDYFKDMWEFIQKTKQKYNLRQILFLDKITVLFTRRQFAE